MWHCWQFPPSSQICSPWLLWCVFLAFLQSLWTCKFSYILGIPIWRAPHYIKIKPKLLTGVHKAIYDLLVVHLFNPISHHHHLILWPQTPCPTFGSQYMLPLHLACWIPIHWWTSLPLGQMWDRHPPCCLPFAGRYAPRLHHQTKCSCWFCLPHMCLAQSHNSALDSRVSIQASYHHLSEGARKGTFNCFLDNQNNAFLCRKDEIYYLSIISNWWMMSGGRCWCKARGFHPSQWLTLGKPEGSDSVP